MAQLLRGKAPEGKERDSREIDITIMHSLGGCFSYAAGD